MNKDPNYNRHAGIVTLDSPLYPNQRRPVRVDEDGIEIYADDGGQHGALVGQDDHQLAQAGIIGWDEAARLSAKQRWTFPTRVKVDASCEAIPAAHDPVVQRKALEALNQSMNDEAAGTAEHGFYASKNIGSDGYSVGPSFTSGMQGKILKDQAARMKPGLIRSVLNGTYPPSLFVHAHPNNTPPSPISKGDRKSAEALNIPIAAIDNGRDPLLRPS